MGALPLHPERSALAGAATRKEKGAARGFAEMAGEKGGSPELSDDEILGLGG